MVSTIPGAITDDEVARLRRMFVASLRPEGDP